MPGKNNPTFPLLLPQLILYIFDKEGSRDQLPSEPQHSDLWLPLSKATQFKGKAKETISILLHMAVVVGTHNHCNWPVVQYAVGTQGFPHMRQACV